MGFLSISPTINLVEFAASLFAGNNEKSEKEQNVSIILKKLYAECKQNRELIRLIKTENINQNSFEAVKSIAPLLKNEAGELVLLGNPEVLKKIALIQEDIDDKDKYGCADSDGEALEEAKTLKQAISFCVNKIAVLKSYSQIQDNGTVFFTKLVLSKRLQNIDTYCKQICESLKDYAPDILESN